MPTVKLTDKTVAAAKAEDGARLELWDTHTPGLCLRVSGGNKVWVWRYRTLDGRQPRLTLGDYTPQASGLRWARDQVEALRVQVRAGGDPAKDRRTAKAEAQAQTLRTFNDLADAYLLACERGEWKPKGKLKRARTLADETGILRRHVRPALGKRELDEIKRADVRAFLRTMIAKGIGAQTNRAQAVIRQCYAYAISEERVEINPATGFAALATETPRARILSDDELKAMWSACVNPTGLRLPPRTTRGEDSPLYVGRSMRIAVQLSMLLLQRRGEIAGMMLSELDLEHARWIIPAARMKNGYPHLVPLPPRALELVKEAIKISVEARDAEAQANDWAVFASSHDCTRAIRPDSLTHAVVGIAKALGIADATPHDLRRTGSTLMTSERLGITPFIRSKVLGHRGDTGGGAAVSVAHYDANDYAPEKRRALTAWENLLLVIVGEREAATNVRKLEVAQ